jgi:hypothetical protein
MQRLSRNSLPESSAASADTYSPSGVAGVEARRAFALGSPFPGAATEEAHARDVVSQGAAKVRRKPRSARRTG